MDRYQNFRQLVNNISSISPMGINIIQYIQIQAYNQSMSDIQTIFSKISIQPYLLNSLTAKYLEIMSAAHNSAVMRWEEVQEIMVLLSEEQQEIPPNQALLLMNAIRIVLMETLPAVQLKSNRIFTWFFMHYAVRVSKLIRSLESALNDTTNEHDQEQLYETIMFGLGFSEIAFQILDIYVKKSPQNKITLPEFYRFIWIALEIVQKLGKKVNGKIRLPNLGISDSQPENTKQNEMDEEQEQPKEEKQNEIQTIKICQLLKMIAIIRRNPTKKIEGKIEGAILDKCVELLIKSLKCGKKKSIKQLAILTENVNLIIENLYHKIPQSKGQNKNKVAASKKEEINIQIKQRIANYLKIFEKKQYQEGFEEDGVMIDERQQSQQEENHIIEVRELTPRFIDEQPAMAIKKLKKKKNKLMKKIQSDIRRSTFNRVQEQRVHDDVRNERSSKREKKQLFILQKQTEEAKKVHKQTKKIKMIQKDSKQGKKGAKKGPMKSK